MGTPRSDDVQQLDVKVNVAADREEEDALKSGVLVPAAANSTTVDASSQAATPLDRCASWASGVIQSARQHWIFMGAMDLLKHPRVVKLIAFGEELLFFYDVASDIVLAVALYRTGNPWWGSLTVAFLNMQALA